MDLAHLLQPTTAMGATWSVVVQRDGDQNRALEHDPDALLRTASVAKVFLLLEVAERFVAGALDPALPVDRTMVSRVHDSGLWHAMTTDVLPLHDAAVLVGAVSDNWATNVLLDLCGLDAVRGRAASIAPGGSRLHDFVRGQRDEDMPETLSEGCASDWATVMREIHAGTAASADACGYVRRWLAQDADLSMVAAAFDLDPLAHDTEDLGIRLWHKTGTDVDVRADVGVLQTPANIVSYAVICNWDAADDSSETRYNVLSTMREVGRHVRELAYTPD